MYYLFNDIITSQLMRFLKAQYNGRTMYLNSFGFPQQILDDESLEAGHVPEVDKGDA